MDAIDAIFTRRSVREYTDEPVPERVVENLLRAAMQAPSPGNQRPWHFILLRDRSTLTEITRFHPYAQMLHTAPLCIVVCGDTNLERYPDSWVQDCSAATQNLLLAARALGFGAVWVGVHPRPERVEPIRTLLRLPEHIIPLSLVAVGRPAVQPPPEDRFDPSRVRRERWE
jgi:nitroreductase